MNRRCIGLKVKSSAENLLAEKGDLYVYILMFINIDLINLKKNQRKKQVIFYIPLLYLSEATLKNLMRTQPHLFSIKGNSLLQTLLQTAQQQ